MPSANFKISGLNQEQVILARKIHGQNKLVYKKENVFFLAIKGLVKEPMILLLLVAAAIYFISGKPGDGFFLTGAIIFVIFISLYQDTRSRNALEKLKNFIQPNCKVIRDCEVIHIKSEDVVVGDCLIVEEGLSIAADGIIVQSNDFSVDESILTGEAFPVFKDKKTQNNHIYLGTTVATGRAIVKVTHISNQTKLGEIGKSLESIQEEKTPLELQISDFVKKMMIIGGFVFLIVWITNYFNSNDFLDSLLKALTLAMSILPEEIPVAFSTFMALGAWRLMKMGLVVKQMKTVETLGSATVICIDKTGTITENKMSLAKLFLLSSNNISDLKTSGTQEEKELIKYAMFASEPIPFNLMEVSLHQAYANFYLKDERPSFHLIHEYPLEGTPPMMTHLFENKIKERIIAAKGAPEALMQVSNLSVIEKQSIEKAIIRLAKEGYRLLAVGKAHFNGTNFPKNQQAFNFTFLGLVAFYDPPKKNIQKVLTDFYAAGIAVKIITGDNAETTNAIAKQIGFKGCEKSISGNELMNLEHKALQACVLQTNVFTRMFPEAKLKIINALKDQNQIVAMTGDGVNDGPALKAAHIGVAMGKKGTEIAKQAASLILLEDDLSKMVDAVAMGRKIYTNLKKAIQYVISIHIPIILTVFIPLALGWMYPNIFSPIHVIFLELIMGPTCSIIYENEPIEKHLLVQKPRPLTSTFFNFKELTTSIIQGLIITLGTLLVFQYAIKNGYSETVTRTMIFTVLIAANIFLTLVNRSFYYSILTTLRYKNNLVFYIIAITITLVSLMICVTPLATFFEFKKLNGPQLLICIGTGFFSVIWYEIIKLIQRRK
jgi:Ca2+-transporting ATPase